jgi:hypothetical protein
MSSRSKKIQMKAGPTATADRLQGRRGPFVSHNQATHNHAADKANRLAIQLTSGSVVIGRRYHAWKYRNDSEPYEQETR